MSGEFTAGGFEYDDNDRDDENYASIEGEVQAYAIQDAAYETGFDVDSSGFDLDLELMMELDDEALDEILQPHKPKARSDIPPQYFESNLRGALSEIDYQLDRIFKLTAIHALLASDGFNTLKSRARENDSEYPKYETRVVRRQGNSLQCNWYSDVYRGDKEKTGGTVSNAIKKGKTTTRYHPVFFKRKHTSVELDAVIATEDEYEKARILAKKLTACRRAIREFRVKTGGLFLGFKGVTDAIDKSEHEAANTNSLSGIDYEKPNQTE